MPLDEDKRERRRKQQRLACKRWRAKNREKVRTTNGMHRLRYNIDFHGYIVARGNQCEICGQSVCAVAYDFHHVDPTNKERSVSGSTFSEIQRIEADKCAMLCGACHRKEHVAIYGEGESLLPEDYTTPDGSTINLTESRRNR